MSTGAPEQNSAAMATRAPKSDAPAAGGRIEVELAQSLGLFEAMTIGIGTMIGAGIFVLPGFIIEGAGPAAVLAFALGGLVALLNALAAAEVGTGMPKSGGGYYFISRALGPMSGAIIGWGSWFGLIFASGFYAIGFGEYVGEFTGLPALPLAIGMTLLLTGLNLVGSKAAGAAQNMIVALLVLVMVLFVGRGVADADPGLPFSGAGFAPFGWGAVLAGTATLFVTYCGFGEIASMAEEIKDPGRNLPRALVGSVVSVTLLYCLVIGLCTMLRPSEELSGATIVADLAGDMMGRFGRVAILVGAVLATVSSANASIMSASRICFAMGRDNMVWPWLNVVHPRFRVPHRAVVVTGLLIVSVLFLGGIELLAEAAGLLHLLMYGLMSLACVILRGARPLNYRPAFRVPFFPWVPLLGAAGTLAISCFIHVEVIVMGLGLIVFALLHYRFWARKRTTVRGAWPAFVRRQVLEPALDRVERLGAEPRDTTSVVVAVGNPHREQARLHVAAALLDDVRGRIIATNVFPVVAGDTLDDDVLRAYRETIAERERALSEQSASIRTAGTQVTSFVPLAREVLAATLSTAEVARSAAVFLGWPESHDSSVPKFDLVRDVARYARCHLLVLREGGPVPPRHVTVFAEPTDEGRLALGVAARLAASWEVSLTAVRVVREDADSEELVGVESALEERVSEVARADVRVLRTGDVAAAVARVGRVGTLVVVPAPSGDADDVVEHMRGLPEVQGVSLLLVRRSSERSMEPWA